MTTSKLNVKSYLGAGAAAFVAALLLACAFALPAFANKEFNAPTTVSDDITRVHVNKLDADTHGYVVGAVMQIIEKDTNTVIDEWVTAAGETHKYEKGSLVVDKVYILRELSAPEGYEKVDDVEFVVNATEGTGLSVVKGTSGQYEQVSVDVIALYDEPLNSTSETVVTQTRDNTETTTTTNTTTTSKAVAPKTGDETPLAVVGALMALGVLIILGLQLGKRRFD